MQDIRGPSEFVTGLSVQETMILKSFKTQLQILREFITERGWMDLEITFWPLWGKYLKVGL